jgi:hypothetical protein
MIAGGGMGMMATGMVGGARSNYGGDGTYMVRHACVTAPRVSIPLVDKQMCATLQNTLAVE